MGQSVVNELRQLQLKDLNAVRAEVEALHAKGYEQQGQWTLGQMCYHLRIVQDGSLDGYSWWLSLFAPLRPVMRWVMLPKILSGNSPIGLRTLFVFAPPEKVDEQEEVKQFLSSIDRYIAYEEKIKAHPGFGRMSKSELEQVHAAHASHHLRFLKPVKE